MKTGLILSVIWIFSVATAYPQGRTQSSGSDVDDLQINLRIVGIDDSNIIFEIQNGITQGSVEIVYGADLNSLLCSPIPIAELSGPFQFNHKFEVAWPHPDFDSDAGSAFFQAHPKGRVQFTSGTVPIPSEDFVFESIGARMIWVEPGTFLMGSPATESFRDPDETQHSVTLTKGYWLGQTEVTRAQWAAVMGTDPSFFTGSGQLPVEQVSWQDCMEFCRRLTELERQVGQISGSMSYMLPTEAQWEYACRERGAATGPFHYGNTFSSVQANFNGNYSYGGAAVGPDLRRATEVKTYTPNGLGLYDMHGNVREWCSDWYGSYPNGAVTDPAGPSSGSGRVLRGGGWLDNSSYCRSANRLGVTHTGRFILLGFRLSLQTGD